MSSDEKQIKEDEVMAIFNRHRCPAELVLPYNLEGPSTTVLKGFWRSRFKGPLWNMDSPWLKAMAFNGLVTVTCATVVAAIGYFTGRGDPGNMATLVVGAYPLIFFVLGPLVYIYLILSNLRKGYKEYAANKLIIPTHIGLTDSGFKLYWRGGYFYNYPSLAIWPEIYKIDLIFDRSHQAPTLKFLYQTGFGRLNLWLPVTGFATSADMKLVLTYFAQFVPTENQGQNLKLMFERNFAPLVEAFENQSLPLLEGLLPERPEKTNSESSLCGLQANPDESQLESHQIMHQRDSHPDSQQNDCIDPPDEGGTLDTRSTQKLGN
jgi:hypothetical protein